LNSKSKFIIAVSNFNYGGIEILVKRLCKVLALKYEVHVFILSNKYDEGLLEDLKNHSQVYLPIQYTTLKLGLINVVGANAVLPIKTEYCKLISESDYVHATDSHSMIFFTSILQNRHSYPKFSVGNYQSEEYLWKSDWWFRCLELECIKKFTAANVFSMNQISIDKLVAIHGDEYFDSQKMPAGIDIPNAQCPSTFYKRKNELICLGRLVKFKSYIEFVIRDIPSIVEMVPDFEFHIYGDGPEREYLTQLSEGLPVVFHGSVLLSDIDNIISSYKVFIGSGTSILTASALGVPSIIGIESCNKSITYGYLHETKGYDYQELGLQYPQMSIAEKVVEALCASKEQYNALCFSARNRSEEFCISKTAQILENTSTTTKVATFTMFKKFKYFFSVLVWSLLNKVKIIDSKKNRHFIK
jgi:glycosyltransferase involved in cell wall biosynthesis